MKKLIAIALIVIGAGVGAFGFSKYDESGATLSVGDVEVTATDERSRTQSYVLMGLAAVCLAAGTGMLATSKS